MKRILFLSFFLLALYSCEPVVTFDRTQPEGIDSLTVIPKKLEGKYLSTNGATNLIIESKRMILHYDYEIKLPRDSTNWDNLTAEEKEGFRLENDSVIEHVMDIDTIFEFSEDMVLKKYKGYYFMNTRKKGNSWYVQKMQLSKGMLTIGSISTKQELKMLGKVNESPVDTTTYQVSFSRKQFHEYIDNKGFSKVDTFTRFK